MKDLVRAGSFIFFKRPQAKGIESKNNLKRRIYTADVKFINNGSFNYPQEKARRKYPRNKNRL
jgi:hypothetical protein